MNRSVSGITFIIVVFISLIFSGNLLAETDVKIAILPFSIDAKQKDHQIKNKIPLMISERLEQEGAKVIISEAGQDTDGWDFPQFRRFGIQSGVDYILTGSIFVTGESISIDSRLINIYETENATSFYADSQNLENLFSAISKISKEIAGELYQKKIITDIAVVGTKRVENDAILRIIDTQPGDIIKPDAISEDLKKIYAMGYFDDVVVKKESMDTGAKVVFEVVEKPSVRLVQFKKNTVYKDEEFDGIVTTRTGSILNLHKLNSDRNRIRLMYMEKNYHNCSITYEIKPLENSQADIVFTIDEGDKVKVGEITFEGNKYFSDKQIKKAIETSEKGFFSFFTSSGDLNESEVNNDVIRIESLYKNNGFIDAKVSDPNIDIGEQIISIHFKINEGDQYTVKTIDVEGDIVGSKEELLKGTRLKETEFYNRDYIRQDILRISDVYQGIGFANVSVTPQVEKNDQEKMMTIIYKVDKGEPVYFNRINISGNSKTRDKVIRRQIKIIEQDLYSKEAIERSFRNLNRLDYFAEIDAKPVKTIDENKMDLDVRIVEKETGNFSIGGGFSSTDGGFISAAVQERNLFGRGQTLRLEGKFGEEAITFNINFFEPYIMDTDVSGGIQVFREDREYDYYDRKAVGTNLRAGYNIFDYTNIGANYNFEDFDISNVQTLYTNVIAGSWLTSSITPFIKYDSRDDLFLPQRGGNHRFSVEYAGEFLGGEIDFTKYLVETSFYFPLFWKFTGILHAEGGYIDDRTGDDINIDYEKFYLGGMDSIRGFDKWDINGSRPGDLKQKGGDKYVQFNAEVTVPLMQKYKIAGVFFYDRGDVYLQDEEIDFGDQYSSYGTGIRWDSPVGPLRLEYAWVIDGKYVKESGDGQFEFAIGATF